MSLSRRLLLPVLLGWALGLWEGFLVLAAYRHNFTALQGWAGILLASGFYGWLFALAGLAIEGLVGRRAAAAGRGRRLLERGWLLFALVAAAWILKRRLATGLDKNLPAALPALALAAALAAAAWRGRRPPGRLPAAAAPALQLLWVSAAGGFLLLAPPTGRGDLPVAPPTGPPPPAGSPNVLLVTWDTVRADSLPLYGGGGLDTPALDRLAAEGVLFEDFQAVAPITGPAHASILTGLFPPEHGLRSNGDQLPSDVTTLAERFAAAGYATGGFVSGLPVTAQFGFDAGFQAFDGRTADRPGPVLLRSLIFTSTLVERLLPAEWQPPPSETPGEVTLARARRWLAGVERPWFLWVHFYDAHFPYRPPARFLAAVRARAAEGPAPVDPELADSWVAQRGEIAWLDFLLGELLASAAARDPGLAHTVVALTADHGECFGEGGLRCSHHRSLFQATQHVAAVVRPPAAAAGYRRGLRVAATSSQVDLAPTLIELAGLPAEAAGHGRSLVPLLRGEELEPWPEGVYQEAFQRQLGQDRRSAWRSGEWTLTVDRSGREALLHAERGQVPPAEADPVLVAGLRQRLESFLAGIEERAGASAADPGAERALEGLGYTGDGS